MQPGLEEQAERALDVDHLSRVVERLGGAAVDQPAHEPVEPVGPAEEHDLAGEIERPVREQGSGSGGHRPILSTAAGARWAVSHTS